MRRQLFATGLSFGLMVSQACAAQPVQDAGRFDVFFAGLKAGEVQYSLEQEAGRYSATGRVKASGLVAAFADFALRAEVSGAVAGPTLAPRRYAATLGKEGARKERVIDWSGALPRLESSEAPGTHWADPGLQGDALDPLTAFWLLVRDRQGADPCSLELRYFDGARRVRLVTGAPRPVDKGMACSGDYIREDGFAETAADSAPADRFTLIYRPRDRHWKLARIEIDTRRGPALLIRR
ncbi:MAG: DUF3108 domain-containing protein [Rhodobacteraceae bacterium]|nr:MAG: DUF3108 domain-containing protein [Paracoccaceae bacterium]